MYRAGYPRVTHPSAALFQRRSLDLHVLGTPPAFILSQDQTLKIKFVNFISQFTIAKIKVAYLLRLIII